MLQPKDRLNRRCYLDKQFKLKYYSDGLTERIYECDKAADRYKNSIKQKHFRIDNANYRRIASAAHYLMKTSETKTLFLLLTFPPWLKGFNPYKNESKLNECFSKFVENLRSNYGCQGYIAVRELGKNTRRYHYHFVCSIPFIPFPILNRAWCAAISDICKPSNNAVSSVPENRIINKLDNPGRAIRYICKYISKCKGQSSKTRVLFVSNNLFRKPVAVRNYENMLERRTGEINLEQYLLKFKSLKVTKLNDYCTALRIDGIDDFNTFCSEILYNLFDLNTDVKADFYAFPLSNSS